jgi:hypothetical protein
MLGRPTTVIGDGELRRLLAASRLIVDGLSPTLSGHGEIGKQTPGVSR